MNSAPLPPRVSFVVPLYNGLEFTRAMLASLRATLPSGLHYEVIFVDNGSTDGTREWLKHLRDQHIRTIFNDRNLGYAIANNRAAEAARGEFLGLLNNDLVLLQGWLEPMLELIVRPEIGIVGNLQLSVRTRQIDHAGIFFGREGEPFHFRPPLNFVATHDVLRAPAVTGACMILSRSFFAELGGFDEGYANGYEDLDLCMRARERGTSIAVALRSTAYHYVGASEGRHHSETLNAARFKARWQPSAVDFARIEPPAIRESIQPADGYETLPFDRGAFATLQVFHPAPGGHSERESSVHLYPATRWSRVRVPLESGLVQDGVALRLDPCSFPATIRIAALNLAERDSRKIVWSATSKSLGDIFEVAGTATLKPECDRWLTLISTGNDPQLRLRPGSIPSKFNQRSDLTIELLLNITESSARPGKENPNHIR